MVSLYESLENWQGQAAAAPGLGFSVPGTLGSLLPAVLAKWQCGGPWAHGSLEKIGRSWGLMGISGGSNWYPPTPADGKGDRVREEITRSKCRLAGSRKKTGSKKIDSKRRGKEWKRDGAISQNKKVKVALGASLTAVIKCDQAEPSKQAPQRCSACRKHGLSCGDLQLDIGGYWSPGTGLHGKQAKAQIGCRAAAVV